jgi:hypothetical protein
VKQERRFLLLQHHAPPLLHPVYCYKRPLKEEEGFLPFVALLWAFGLLAFGFGEETFTLGAGTFWKGKELLKRKC